MARNLSIPVLIIIGMILCGPGDSAPTLNGDQSLAADFFADYDAYFESYRPGDATSYHTGGYQRRSSNAAPGGRDSRGSSWGDQRRRSWQDRISDDMLLDFLKEHEKELASRLEGMRKERSRYFSDQVRALKALYGPVIEEMKEDPKAGMMSLEKIRLRLKIQGAVNDVKDARQRYKEREKKKLTEHVTRLFDVIVNEEEYDIDQMEDWLSHPDERRWLSRNEYRSNRNYIDENRENISAWKITKDEIVSDRVKKLLQEHRDFPWGN